MSEQTVRIAAWNCYQGTDRKVPVLLERVQPDVAVIPESSKRPELATGSLARVPVPHAWAGTYEQKGLGIFAPSAQRLEVLAAGSDSGAGHALAVRAHVEPAPVTVLGVWTQPFASGGWRTPYMNALIGLLDDHRRLLEAGDVIVAGDVNCSAQSSPADFPALLETIAERYGLRSAYHDAMGCAPGDEEHMTLRWRRKEDAGFHCDLVLLPETWHTTSVEIGAFADWGHADLAVSSDHAPVVADVRRTSDEATEVKDR